MHALKIILPAVSVLALFAIGHLFVNTEGLALYEAIEIPSSSEIDSENAVLQDSLLPNKYNYLKIENVFSGRLSDTDELFSLEVAIVTYQPTVSSDFFIQSLREKETDLIAEITKVVVDMNYEKLSSVSGRVILTGEIQKHLNSYLEDANFDAGIHEVFITNYNIL